MKKTLLLVLLSMPVLGFSQVQPTVYNATFDKIPKSSGSDCSCSGWINKDIADQAESSTLDASDAVKLDNLESDGVYQEVAVVANSVYTLDLDYQYNTDPTTTDYLEIIVLKGSGYAGGYVPAYDPPASAAQSGFGYTAVADVESAANQVIRATVVPPGDTSTHAISQITFNTGSETSIAIFIRAVGPYNAAIHGDPTKDKGWMNGDSEVRIDNLVLVNTTNLSAKDVLASKVKLFPNPAKDYITVLANNVQISSVDIYSILGKKVLSTKALVNNRLNVSNLANGIYFMKLNAEGISATKKIVIE